MKIISIAVVLVLSLMVAQAAKADDILFNDLGDIISVSPLSASLTVVPGTCQNQITGTPNLDVCSVMLLRTGQTIISATGNFTINLNSPTPVQATYLLSEDANKTLLSDTFLSTIVPGTSLLGITTLPGSAAFVFDSDLPTVEGLSTVPCLGLCNAPETGGPQLVGTITWSGGITDRILIESDKEGVVPEPATLVLLGSGLAMTGGFLRRRLRLA